MVNGLEVFREHFGPFKDQFILIGGVACDLLHEAVGQVFRATRDFDVVLCLERVTPAFSSAIWDFVRGGEYQIKARSDGRPVRFRFEDPKNPRYPSMLEIFSPGPESIEVLSDQRVVPIEFSGEASDLSAILIDGPYYDFLQAHTLEDEGIRIASGDCLIPLKARAFLDLTKRKAAGEKVDSDRIRKQKLDVFRLYRLLQPGQAVIVDVLIREDIRAFVDAMRSEEVDLRQIIATMEKPAILQDLLNRYVLAPGHTTTDEP